MAEKKLRFDLMNVGEHVRSDIFDCETDTPMKGKPAHMKGKPTQLDRNELAKKLGNAARMWPDLFPKDTEESSDDSEDDCNFPETLKERARRMSFQHLRKNHYTEFSTVELARQLIEEEFSSSEAFRTEEEVIPPTSIYECPPCPETIESVEMSRTSSEAEIIPSPTGSSPEPGSSPSHPCYKQLGGTTPDVIPAQEDHDRVISNSNSIFSEFTEFPAFMPLPGPTSRVDDDDDFFNFEAKDSLEKLPAKQTRLLYTPRSRHAEPKRTIKKTARGKNPFLLSSQEAPDEPTGTVKKSDNSEKKKQRKVKGVLQISKRTNAKAD